MSDSAWLCGSWSMTLLQVTVCVTLGLVASILWRGRPARAHQILLTAMAAALMLPALHLGVRHFELGLLAPASQIVMVSAPPMGLSEPPHWYDPVIVTPEPPDGSAPSHPDLHADVTPSAQVRVASWSGRRVVHAGWLTASVILLLRLLWQFLQGIVIVRRAGVVGHEDIRQALAGAVRCLRVRRPVDIRSSDSVRSPVIWCWCRQPVLLLPRRLGREARACDWIGVFCHELAHWKRYDHLSGLLAELLVTALPWHPLMWWARNRLVRLSEDACDDWVLNSGRRDVDYAESLFKLTSNRSPACMPGIIGKERTMKQRVERILKGRTGNPRAGIVWTLGLLIVTLSASVGIALAQERPANEESRRRQGSELRQMQRESARELSIVGRRNVLGRLLGQLVEQTQDTERRLEDMRDAPREERQVVQAELDTLRDQIARIERQLVALDQSRPGQASALDQRRQRVENRLRDLRTEARAMEGRLDRMDDPDAPEAREFRATLDRLHAEIGRAEERLERINQEGRSRERVAPGPEQPEVEVFTEPRETPAAVRAMRQRRQIERQELLRNKRMRLVRIRQELQALADRGREDSDQYRELRETQQSLRNELRTLNTPEAPEPAVRPGLNREVDELRGQVQGLNERMDEMHRLLEQLVRQNENPEQPRVY